MLPITRLSCPRKPAGMLGVGLGDGVEDEEVVIVELLDRVMEDDGLREIFTDG
jgi:hypothetical protein